MNGQALQAGECYVLCSEQIVKLHERLDARRWIAVTWNGARGDWSKSLYAIEERMIDYRISAPQSQKKQDSV